jgi:tripartite-type tricarboxylate transporter receptor subunit TctC
MRHRTFLRLIPFLFLGIAAAASAADFPERPVRVVIPYAAGGAVDTIGREMAAKLSELWKQPVVVDNRPGATGLIGAQAVLASQGDPHTLLLTASAPVVLAPAISGKASVNYLTELLPVTTVASWDLILVASPELQANDVKSLLSSAKASGKPLSYASAGNGAVNHVAGAVFAKLAGIDMVHVPYKGDGPALTDLLAGRVTLSFISSQVALPQIRAGKLKALAVAGPGRMAALPSVPTMVESGIKDFDFTAWTGLFAAPGTSAATVRQIQDAVGRVMNQQAIREKLLQTGSVVDTGTPAAFEQRIRSESAKWRSFIQLTGIKEE